MNLPGLIQWMGSRAEVQQFVCGVETQTFASLGSLSVRIFCGCVIFVLS